MFKNSGTKAMGGLGKVSLKPSDSPSLNLNNRGMSTGYAFILGLIGLAAVGFAWTILDQVVSGDIWNFAIERQLNGTYLNIFSMMWRFILIAITFAFVIGMIVTSHKMKNEY